MKYFSMIQHMSGGSLVKNPPANARLWKILSTEEPSRLQYSPQGRKESDTTE